MSRTTASGAWQADHPSVWRVGTLREHFRLYEDVRGVIRCDPWVRFLGLPVVGLHYRIEPLAG